jgi:hypothetical protein
VDVKYMEINSRVLRRIFGSERGRNMRVEKIA